MGIERAVAEVRPEARAAAVAEFVLADSDAHSLVLIDRFRPDGIVVATPANAHEALATEALRLGIPVLVEKPVAENSAAVARLCAAAAGSRAFLQPGHILRFSAGHRALRDVLAGGAIGRLLRFSSRRYRDRSHAERYPDIDPVLMTLVHDIDLALWFDPSLPVAVSARRNPLGTAASLTTAHVESAAGVEWLLSTAWVHPGPDCPPDRVEIFGTEGSAELEVGSHIDVFGPTHRRIELARDDDPLRTELECFVEGIRAGKSQSPVSPDEALTGLQLAERIMETLQAP